jgi:hypothetical protein
MSRDSEQHHQHKEDVHDFHLIIRPGCGSPYSSYQGISPKFGFAVPILGQYKDEKTVEDS